MSHLQLTSLLADPTAALKILAEISWRLPLRILVNLWQTIIPSNSEIPSRTSLRLAVATSIFAPTLTYNWHLLLSRPTRMEEGTGLLFPDIKSKSSNEIYGFHGFLYTSQHSEWFGRSSLEGVDAVWIHAHGGGFYAGEARQYHNTYLRWVDKAYIDFSLDMRILAVEYRTLSLLLTR